MRLLFLHGAGGYDEDRELATELTAVLGAELRLPRLPDDDMSVATWSRLIGSAVDDLTDHDLLVAHSFGGSMLLQVLAARGWPRRAVALLALPNWGPDGWDVAEYDLRAADRPADASGISLYHCGDDEVVPFGHVRALHAVLPGARTVEFATGGHQFLGRAPQLARDLAAQASPPGRG